MKHSSQNNEVKRFLDNNPDKKLNEWLTEDVPVKTVEFDPQTRRKDSTTVCTGLPSPV